MFVDLTGHENVCIASSNAPQVLFARRLAEFTVTHDSREAAYPRIFNGRKPSSLEREPASQLQLPSLWILVFAGMTGMAMRVNLFAVKDVDG